LLKGLNQPITCRSIVCPTELLESSDVLNIFPSRM